MAQVETGIPGAKAENDGLRVTQDTTAPVKQTGIPGVVSKDDALAVEIVVES